MQNYIEIPRVWVEFIYKNIVSYYFKVDFIKVAVFWFVEPHSDVSEGPVASESNILDITGGLKPSLTTVLPA
jgi:hypothetical protein